MLQYEVTCLREPLDVPGRRLNWVWGNLLDVGGQARHVGPCQMLERSVVQRASAARWEHLPTFAPSRAKKMTSCRILYIL